MELGAILTAVFTVGGVGLVFGGLIAFAHRQFVDVEFELLHQRQDHRRRDRAVVVFHLVEIGERNSEALGKRLLRQAKPGAGLAKFRAGEEFQCGHKALRCL